MPLVAITLAAVMLVMVLFVGAFTGTTSSQACQPGATPPDQSAPVSDIPPNYLALYRKAAAEYRIPWNILAAVGSVESDHGRGRGPGIRSGNNHAGAGGPMQFLASTWASFGVDGNHDRRKDRYDPADAIPAAARYLRHNGAPQHIRKALWAYNHSHKYVNEVLHRADRYQRAPATTPNAPPPRPDQTEGCGPEGATNMPPASGTVAKIIAFAMAQRGKPYVFGANGPNAWDCSSLVQAAYQTAGYTIPRTTFLQWPFGARIPKGKEQPGDLVFFNSGPGTSTNNPGHVGMVISPGKMINARCTLCRPAIGVSAYRRNDWTGVTRPLLKFSIE